MIYNKFDLENKNIQFLHSAVQRYLHVFHTDKKKFKKLKTHEKDFFFSNLIIFEEKKDCVPLELEIKFSKSSDLYYFLQRKKLLKFKYDLYDIQEADEYLFYRLILTYFKNLYFQSPVKGPYGNLTTSEIQRDRKYIERNLKSWLKILKSNSGRYIPFILNEYNRKVKILDKLRFEEKISSVDYLYKEKQLQLVSFHIYYLVKFWFDNINTSYYKFIICGIEFVFDVFSYVHILSRHYMPSVNNFLVDVTFNTELDLIDIRNIPYSIEEILRHYSFIFPINIDDQYILLEFRKDIYILWIDYRTLDHLGIKSKVMQIRTFYKCGERDKEKLKGKKKEMSYLKFIYFFG
ncbi:hypothetical protein SMI01S_07770 [Sphingobacterium mizutaii NBRC 14946 = DSM 11724]|uniref:Uncharacterized protein n=2 Tax=Sphingobacterium mizutaii TaxID=1010 RepID=A0AAJ5C093_9SPHI|nr:hypothetical protein [Sphingobacterium mizutaii]GEM67171.1 hypothetical protein SMI01S_07770 [Sphingobacterium mizutaii NBRC 14946 = DSM 11724]SDK98135.1 hypothetical protein SAMN05192578_101645 [Sphingobacterium mizutaii]SNV49351.1 Uncharacterised protein [Sphingobacterium mizutaii]